jgi:DNA primase catalytic core
MAAARPRSKYDARELETAGLVIAGDAGKRYDRFRDRIMFPIHDSRGQVIGFGGRVLGEGEPKYLNSPETPLFSKGRELYGLFLARNAIRDAGRVVVVEGYMDVVALAQHGIDYAVATLGTATTPVHSHKLFRLTDAVVFCFDGDAAGRKAAWRALENTLPALADGKNALFLFLPDGEDPDDYVRKRGKAGFEALFERARRCPVSSEQLIQHPPASAEGRAPLVNAARPMSLSLTAPVLAAPCGGGWGAHRTPRWAARPDGRRWPSPRPPGERSSPRPARAVPTAARTFARRGVRDAAQPGWRAQKPARPEAGPPRVPLLPPWRGSAARVSTR